MSKNFRGAGAPRSVGDGDLAGSPYWTVPFLVLFLITWSAPLVCLAQQPLDCFQANIVCKNETVENAGPVPGKAGEMGVLLCRHHDDLGNMLEIWCLKANNDHLTDFGFLYKAKGVMDADAVWIGACTFLRGQNKWAWDFTDADRNGKPDKFGTITWKNTEPGKVGDPPNQRDGKNDWFYSFDTNKAAKNLLISKTEGRWVAKRPQGRQPYWDWEVTRSTPADMAIDAPKNFKDLKWNDEQITLGNGEGGIGTPHLTAVAAVANGLWDYSLHALAMSGLGSEADPFFGTEVLIQPGDLFTIAGGGITGAMVSGQAALADNGGWLADSFSNTYATYRATTSAILSPGWEFGGFQLFSDFPAGMVNWAVSGADEQTGISGMTVGPVPEPSSMALAATGMLAVVLSIARRSAVIVNDSGRRHSLQQRKDGSDGRQ